MAEEKTLEKKISIPSYAKVKVYWDDKPENYSREARNKIRTQIARKYGVSKSNIDVVYRPIKVTETGETIEITGAGIDNIMDVNYQRSLMKELIERNSVDVDFERLVKLDEKVNAEIDVDVDAPNHRKWEIKWVTLNNFLCFGTENYVNFGKHVGLNVVTSEPLNQGGKTTFSIDAPKFLLFGSTTKTSTNEQIFNQYSDGNEMVVRGMVSFEGNEVIIERTLTRTPKRNGNGFTIKNKLVYYEIMPDGEEKVLEEEQAIATTELIANTIGSEKDFDITVLATARNLEDLIDLTPTNSGKLLTKFIGLEVIEHKEKAVRTMHNEFKKKMKANIYDPIVLRDEIDGYDKEDEVTGETKFVNGHVQNIEIAKDLLVDQNKFLEQVKVDITELNNKKDELFNSKKPVEVEITQLNPLTIESDIATITESGKTVATKIAGYDEKIAEYGNVAYDENEYFALNKAYNAEDVKIAQLDAKIEAAEAMVEQLKNGEVCPTCKRALDEVDHSKEIAQEEKNVDTHTRTRELAKGKLADLKTKIDAINESKVKVDARNKLELAKDKAELEIETLRTQIKVKKADLKKYKANEEAIKHNQDVEAEIEKVKTDISVKEQEKEVFIRKIMSTESSIEVNQDKIVEKEKLIKTIAKEAEVDRLFKIYIDLVGKNGISKLVLRSVLPILNSEIYRLLEDACDFEVELNINAKNEVQFTIVKDEVVKPLKSGSGFERTAAALALRCVLGKMSHLPMPNFITFDEVLGKVANVNIEKMKPMFDKIKDMYDIVFLITHNDLVKDWADNIITIKKTNNISKLHAKY